MKDRYDNDARDQSRAEQNEVESLDKMGAHFELPKIVHSNDVRLCSATCAAISICGCWGMTPVSLKQTHALMQRIGEPRQPQSINRLQRLSASRKLNSAPAMMMIHAAT